MPPLRCLPTPDPEPEASTLDPVAWLVTGTGLRRPVRCPCTLGRDATHSLPLADPQLSRRHATISQHGEREFWLTDHASRNGTYLNAHRIHQPERLFDGDQLRVGRSELTFRAVGVPSRPVNAYLPGPGVILAGPFVQHWLILVEIPGGDLDPTSQQLGVEACRVLIEARGGAVERYVTDGLLAEWPDHRSGAAAVAGAVTDLRQLQQVRCPGLGLVVHWGPAEDVEVGSSIEAGLQGPAILQVLRMQKLGHQLGEPILVSAAAAEHLRYHLPLRSACQHELPGTPHLESFLTL